MDRKPAHNWYAVDLGLVPYPEAHDLQLRLAAARAQGRLTGNVLLFLEHPPVFTLGRRGGREHLLVSEAYLTQSGVPIVQVERGGEITYHGPGQLVVYPIVHLPGAGLGVVDLVEALEEAMIRTCRARGVPAGRNKLNRGAWVDRRKIGSVGIAVRRGVSFHGLALNVNPDLKPFEWIRPCGLEGIGVTSIQAECGHPVDLADVKALMRSQMESLFHAALQPIDRGELCMAADLSSDKADTPAGEAASGRDIAAQGQTR